MHQIYRKEKFTGGFDRGEKGPMSDVYFKHLSRTYKTLRQMGYPRWIARKAAFTVVSGLMGP